MNVNLFVRSIARIDDVKMVGNKSIYIPSYSFSSSACKNAVEILNEAKR